jgi:hypothetical protein
MLRQLLVPEVLSRVSARLAHCLPKDHVRSPRVIALEQTNDQCLGVEQTNAQCLGVEQTNQCLGVVAVEQTNQWLGVTAVEQTNQSLGVLNLGRTGTVRCGWPLMQNYSGPYRC